MALLLAVTLSSRPALGVGNWIKVTQAAPGGIGLMLLLSDGSVMAQNKGGSAWYRLLPNTQGNYTNGGWTTRASMGSTRLYYSSAVLRDGRVFVAGAEYGNGWLTSEVYDPINDAWTATPVPLALLNTNNTPTSTGQNVGGFSDSGCKILPDGRVLVAPVYPATANGTLLYNPVNNSWSSGPAALTSQNEASWVKLPDDSILTIDNQSTTSERYIPSLNLWTNDNTLSANIYDNFAELGAGLLLPNGKAFFLGGNGNTAIYAPSGNPGPGKWTAGPAIPGGLAAPDAPAAMMVNGKILCAFSPPLYSTNIAGKVTTVFPPPVSFYEYDYNANSFTSVNGPTGQTHPIPAYQGTFLDLPDGTVLFSDGTTNLYVYQPDGAPVGSGKPAITSVDINPNGTYHLTGTLLNGISEGAAYGDDAQMDSNYPLVRFLGGGGTLSYGTTFNWTSTGVQTGSKVVGTDFGLPNGAIYAPGSLSLQVVANGIGSDPVTIYSPVWVDFNYTGATQDGTFFTPYNTLGGGVNAAQPFEPIFIKSGISHERLTLSKPMTLTAQGGPATIGQ